MSTVEQMVSTHPVSSPLDAALLRDCIEACFGCAQSCTACADACLSEPGAAGLAECIRRDLNCADVCTVTGRLLSRQGHVDVELVRAQLQACAQACRISGDECAEHGEHMEHCRVCAQSCRRCEEACQRLLEALAA